MTGSCTVVVSKPVTSLQEERGDGIVGLEARNFFVLRIWRLFCAGLLALSLGHPADPSTARRTCQSPAASGASAGQRDGPMCGHFVGKHQVISANDQ
jgi:hypothetical protein